MTRILVSLSLLIALTGVVAAQGSASSVGTDLSIGSFDPESATAPVGGVEGPGIKIGEGTVIHPVIGLSTGVVSNVFREETDIANSGVLRLLAQVGAGSLSTARLTPTNAGAGAEEFNQGSFQYRASLRASYDFMLSGNDTVNDQGGLGLGATLRGLVNPMGAWSFGFDENFTRLIRAANFETDADTNRNINVLGLNLIYHPRGRSVSGYLYYNNTIDVFERSELEFADRIQHRVGIHPMWRLLPQTVVYADISQGVYGGLGDASMKVDSYPFVAQAGIGTLLTPKVTVNVHAGYANGFYSVPPSYSSVIAGAQVGYRYTPLGRVALTYDLKYEDSVNANFYHDHIVRLWFQQLVVPFAIMVQPEVHFRRYEGITLVNGPPTRNDLIFSVVGGVHYNFRDSLSATLDYRFSAVETDYRYMATTGEVDDPSFVRHQLLLGMRWAM